jgi:hypothetical protein
MSVIDEAAGLFRSYGLDSLADWLVAQNVEGKTPEQIVTDLRQTPEYKARFPAMEELRRQAVANNMPIPTESQYLQMEQSYRTVLQNSGLPQNMFDSADDFKRLLEAQVDPTEVQERVAAARVAVDQTDPYVRGQLRTMYGITDTDLMAYALDPERNSDYIRRVATAATVAGLSQRQGLTAEMASWERYSQDMINRGMGAGEISDAVGQASMMYRTQSRLASIEGGSISTEDVFDVVVGDNAEKALKSQQRAQREKARFSGTSGITGKSMSSGRTI